MFEIRRAALYTRVSSAGQVDNYSLEYQETQLREYCARNNIEVVGVYQDAGISGSTVSDRPAIAALIKAAAAKKFDQVLIYKVDRFTRADPWDLYPLVKGLMDLDVKLTSATESFDLSNDDGQLIFSILANFAARERRGIIQRTLGGKRASAKAGRFTGGTLPFGYALDKATGRLQPDLTPWWRDLTKADVARAIFERYVEAGSAADVVEWLIREGIPAPRTVWNPATVNQIIRNPVYKGDLVWGKRSHRLHEASRVNPSSEWVVCAGAHEPIVPPELWNRCATARRQRRRGRRKDPKKLRLLDGYLCCAQCGSALTARNGGRDRVVYYTCASRYNAARRRDGVACMDAPFWPEERLESLIWGHIESLVTTGEMVQRLREETLDREKMLKRLEHEASKQRRRLSEIEKKEQRLLDFALSGMFSQDVLAQKQLELRQEREAARQALDEAEARFRDAQASSFTELDLDAIQTQLRNAVSENTGVETRRKILGLLLDGKIAVTSSGEVRMRLKPLAVVSDVDKLDVPTRRAPLPGMR